MTSHFVAGAYSVGIANLETGEVSELPSPSVLVPKVDSPTDDRVYRLEDVGAIFTFELSPEDAARLWWIIIRGSDWLWRRYRQTLNCWTRRGTGWNWSSGRGKRIYSREAGAGSAPEEDEMVNSVIATAQYEGTIKTPDKYWEFCDPMYAGARDPMGVFFRVPRIWRDTHVYTVRGNQGISHREIRALIITSRTEIPAELLSRRCIGAFVFLDEGVGVDSAMVGIYDGDELVESRLIYPAGDERLIMGMTYVQCWTFKGDGVYPIALWGENGEVHTMAILMDEAYYGEELTAHFYEMR